MWFNPPCIGKSREWSNAPGARTQELSFCSRWSMQIYPDSHARPFTLYCLELGAQYEIADTRCRPGRSEDCPIVPKQWICYWKECFARNGFHRKLVHAPYHTGNRIVVAAVGVSCRV